MKTKSTPNVGVIENPLNPITLAISAGATFGARPVRGGGKQMADLVQKGIDHKGFSLIDALSPCVTYNKVNTYDFFRQRVYDLQKEGHDPMDVKAAFAKAIEWPTVQQERIPIGLFYRPEGGPTDGEVDA